MKSFIKKMLSFGIVVCVLTVPSFAAFVDMPTDEGERAALTRAVENGLINGISSTEIAPYATMTRAQMGTIVVRAMGAIKEADISKFVDAKPNAWYYNWMRRAVAMGAFQGDGGVSLYPNNEITYQEAFLVLSRVFDLRYEIADVLDKYEDGKDVASWAKSGVSKIVSGGYYDGEKLNPKAPINRVEFAKIMDKIVTTYIDTPGTYTTLPKGNTLVRCDGVVIDGVEFKDATTATEGDIIIIGDGVNESKLINLKGVNAAIRGGNAIISGEIGIVRTAASGAMLSPDVENLTLKTYADGTKGTIEAKVDGSYILVEQEI